MRNILKLLKNPEALTAGPPESAVTDPGWNFMKSE